MAFKFSVGSSEIDISSHTNSLQVYNVAVDVISIAYTNTALGTTEVETTVHTSLPCTIKWKSGKEKILFDKKTHMLDAIMRCRVVVPAITSKNRIKYNSEYYDIVDIYDFNNLGTLYVIGLKKVEKV